MNAGLALRAALTAADLIYRRPFLADAKDARSVQEQALRRILAANAGAVFGQAHGFGGLSSRDAFRDAIPVQTHDSLSAAIQRQAETGSRELTMAPPVFYARTSGTTGPVRDFPVTPTAQTAQKAAQRIFAATLHRGSGFFAGRIAGFGGAHIEGRLPNGQPFGSASGQTYASAPPLVRRSFVVPPQAFDIADPAQKYHAYAVSALAADDLTGIITANPSTLLSIFAHIRENTEAVLRDLANAQARPDRARMLEAVLGQGRPLGHIWPRLNTLATWTCGNCGVALDQLRPMLPPDLQVVEIGYRASEFIGTINVDATANLCLPDIRHSVFEFVEEDRWERGDAAFLWLDQIEAGAALLHLRHHALRPLSLQHQRCRRGDRPGRRLPGAGVRAQGAGHDLDHRREDPRDAGDRGGAPGDRDHWYCARLLHCDRRPPGRQIPAVSRNRCASRQ